METLRAKGHPYHASMSPLQVSPMSRQMIAEFYVNDLEKPKGDKYNWHLQNTSQWIYAGAIVVDKEAIKRDDERVVSTHH